MFPLTKTSPVVSIFISTPGAGGPGQSNLGDFSGWQAIMGDASVAPYPCMTSIPNRFHHLPTVFESGAPPDITILKFPPICFLILLNNNCLNALGDFLDIAISLAKIAYLFCLSISLSIPFLNKSNACGTKSMTLTLRSCMV